MTLSEQGQTKFNEATTLIEKVKVMLEYGESEIIYNKVGDVTSKVDDIALIQCFYGTDISRIRATTTALEFNLQMTRLPSTWVFVECQRKKSDCVFGWLSRYGIKYKFVQMKDDLSTGIQLKNALWNIGVSSCSENNLCFVDSDVVICNSNWVENAKSAFVDGYDVLSLSAYQYYEEDDRFKLHESIGHEWKTHGVLATGHCGFTIGLTRHALFDVLSGFDPALILDDIQTFRRIFGDKVFKPYLRWCEPIDSNIKNFGFNLKLGFVEDNLACHVWHGDNDSRYGSIVELLKFSGIKSYSEIIDYDKTNFQSLPVWMTKDFRALALQKTLIEYGKFKHELNINSKYDITDRYLDILIDEYGKPDETHPLFVCTVVKDGFGITRDVLTNFRNAIDDEFSKSSVETHQPTVVFFTDFKCDDATLNIVPLKKYDAQSEWKQCLRKDLKFPKNSLIYFVPVDYDFENQKLTTKVWLTPKTIENTDGTVLISK